MNASNNLAVRKLALAQWLFDLENEPILEKIEELMRIWASESAESEDFPQSHLESIARGEADFASGRVISLDDFRKKYGRYGLTQQTKFL